MFFTDGFNIKIPRGDSAAVKFTFTDKVSGLPYILPEGISAVLDVFPVKGAQSVISKEAGSSGQLSDGSVTFSLSPEDTDVPCCVYRYTIRLVNADGSACDTQLGFPDEALFAVGMDCPKNVGFAPEGTVDITVERGGSDLPVYTGAYTVSPRFNESVTLETAGHSCSGNITVLGVPLTETENEYGGITLTIGG